MPPKFTHITSGKAPSTQRTKAAKGDDIALARAYLNKADQAKGKGIEFTISLTSFKNMLKSRKCFFTGLPLTAETFSIDRIDNSKGYIAGNVAAVHLNFNQMKAMIENPTSKLSIDNVTKAMVKLSGRINKGEK